MWRSQLKPASVGFRFCVSHRQIRMRICHAITASSVKLLQLHGKEIPHNTSFCVSLACHYLLYSPTHSSSLNSYLLTYAYTKHQNWTKYPGPIRHLILYRYQETAIQWAFVEFCAANEGWWRMTNESFIQWTASPNWHKRVCKSVGFA